MKSKFLSALCLCASLVGVLSAAPPTLAPLFPAGGQRGATVELNAKAKFWSNDKSLAFDGSKVKIAADAAPGTHWLRAVNDDGASALRPFIVGTLPEVLEQEPNDDPKQAHSLAEGCTVNGKLAKSGETDCFSIAAKKGQTLVASLEANRTLKSPMDAVIQIVSLDGFILDENHDFRGLDPQVTYPIPKDGTYVVRVFAFPSQPDTSIRFSGAETYIYRLTITTGGFLDHCVPLAAIGKPFEPRGWNLPPDATPLTFKDGVAFHPKLGGATRPKLDPKATTHLIAKPGEEVAVPFTAKKGQSFAIEASSRSLGLPVDPVIRVVDKEKKTLARAEPPKLHSDTALSFSAPADGDYSVVVSDLYSQGGPRHAFALRIAPQEPDYELTVASDRFTIPVGKPLEAPVKIARRGGFAKPIVIAPSGLPAGVTFSVKPPGEKPDPNTVTLVFTAAKPTAGGPFRITGTVKDDPAMARIAKAPLAEFDDHTESLWVNAGEAPPEPKKKK